ncbi:MAG TPA: hypothetical protein PKO47_12545, partial [bacterium]|nr:hypothetical protein [bacterium]
NNGVMVVSYLGDCGATVDMDANVSVCMTNDDLQNLGNRTGNVFFAYHARGVTVTKVSPDTVKIIYAASEVRTMRYYVNGVNFVYEENWKYFH